jgi:hypothetical protein
MIWEYHIINVLRLKLPILDANGRHAQLTQHLNELGQQGWEYVGPIDGRDNILFKRAKEQQ